MAVNLSALAGAGQQFFTDVGVPLSGGKLYSYAAGTTTPQATYTTAAGSIAHANPIILDSAGRVSTGEIWLTAGSNYKFVLKTSTDTTIATWDNITGINGTGITSNASNVQYDPAGTGAVSTTVQAKLRQTVSVQDFGAAGNGSTDDTAAFQLAFNALTSGGELVIPNGTYKLTSTITVSNANVSVSCSGTLTWTTLGASKNGLTISANNFLWDGGRIYGPSVGTYVVNERFISMIGTSTSNRKTGLKVYNAEIYYFGSVGIYTQFVDNIIVKNNYIHDCGYAGAIFLSSNYGNFEANKVKNITPGTVGNMYGVSLSHDSTNYSTDPNAGTKLATNPFCWDWYIGGNHIENNAWEGIDCHGGYEICITGNHVYATYGGIACSGSSGSAANYAGWNNVVTNNVVDADNSDGTASGYENQNYGINLNGGSTVNHKDVVCTGNVVKGHGNLGNPNNGAILAVYMTNGNISNNIIQKWGGSGINITSSQHIVINGNEFLELGGAAAGVEYAIQVENTSSLGNTLTITNNSMYANGGTAGRIGVHAPVISTLPYFNGNNFLAATVVPFLFTSAPFLVNSQDMPIYRVSISNPGTGETIDISAMTRYSRFQLYVTSGDAASLVTNLVNGVAFQNVYLYGFSSTTWVFNRSVSQLSAGTNFPGAQYASLVLENVATSGGTQWIEISRSINS
jgi:hypothetical protein